MNTELKPDEHRTGDAEPPIRLGGWNVYFLVKLVLYWKQVIGLHPLENLAFAALLLLPMKSPRWRKARTIAAIPLAIVLLYYDSWLPPIKRALSQTSVIANFTFSYLVELLGRFVNWEIVAMLVITWVGYRIIAVRVRVGVIVVAMLLAPSAIQLLRPSNSDSAELTIAQTGAATGPSGAQKTDFDGTVSAFFAKEAARSVSFAAPAAGDPPFDVIFIHICSLSWDDIRAVGLENHPLWKRFDIVLSNFNSASTYSGPAAIRIMRATCGQSTHSGLYQPVSDKCYLMSSLKQAGFKPELVMNHDGHFDNFLKLIQDQGSMNISPMPIAGLQVGQHAFDDSPVYDDLSVLSRWLENRTQENTPRIAAYYNTISLHDGNHLLGPNSNRNSLDTYKIRLATLFDELDGFMQKLETSNRRALVVMVPEHGAAVRGDKMQIAGLREIPTPAITLVPVGIKVIGPGAKRNDASQRIDTPTSFLAVSDIVAKMLTKSPFASAGFSVADYVSGLPVTNFVAENETMLMMNQNGRYFLRQDGDGWSEYKP